MITSEILEQQRTIWQKNQNELNVDFSRQKELSQYRQKIGMEEAWVLARKALRSLENGNFEHARKLHQQSQSFKVECYEISLIRTWFMILDRKQSDFLVALKDTLQLFLRQEWMLSTHEMMRFYALLLEMYRLSGDDNPDQRKQLSLAILYSLLPDPESEQKECTHRRKDLSPQKIRAQVESALIEMQYKPLYSPALMEMLQDCLRKAFQDIGREDLIQPERKPQQDHWFWLILMLLVYTVYHQFILLFAWIFIWVIYLVAQKRRLRSDLKTKPKSVVFVPYINKPNSRGN